MKVAEEEAIRIRERGIITEPHGIAFKAYLAAHPAVWEAGPTRAEAVGRLFQNPLTQEYLALNIPIHNKEA